MPETQDLQINHPEIVLKRWQDRLQVLVREVKAWVEPAGWRTRTIEKPIDDRVLGRHMVPVLLMEKNVIEVALNPVSPRVAGSEGAVDLYLVPAYDDIASLYFREGEWVIQYAFPADSALNAVELPLSAETINQVLNAIVSNG